MIAKSYLKTKNTWKIKFSYKPENAATVEILGLQGDWDNAIAMQKKKDGTFAYETSLPKESKHEFKYLVDATEWVNEPEADAQVPNTFGTTNSLISL
jgi:hypothetical protein